MERHVAAYGLRTFHNVNDEPWHIQPSEIPAGRRRRRERWQLEPFNLPGTPTAPRPEPTPEPIPIEDDDMQLLTRYSDNSIWVVASDLSWKFCVPQETHDSLKATGLYKVAAIDPATLELIPGKQ